MSQLDELYKAMKTFRKMGVPVTEEQAKKANDMEEEIIRKEILPLLNKKVESALRSIKRELALGVDYVPGQSLNVYLRRKQNFTSELTDIKKMVLDPEVTHGNLKSPLKNKMGLALAKDMSITFPDGSVIEEKTATESFCEFIKRVGVEEVREVVEKYELKINHVPMISNRRDVKYGSSQKDLGNGWLLMTHCDTNMKQKMIETISNKLGLGVMVTQTDRERNKEEKQNKIL